MTHWVQADWQDFPMSHCHVALGVAAVDQNLGQLDVGRFRQRGGHHVERSQLVLEYAAGNGHQNRRRPSYEKNAGV